MDSSAHLDRAAVIRGDQREELRVGTDRIFLRATDVGGVQVIEYESDDRVGPPPHTHPWEEIEYVIEGTVDFFVGDAWHSVGAGGVQVLPAGSVHSVRVPVGTARVLMVTIGSPYDGFARDLAVLGETAGPGQVVEVAFRHGVRRA